MSTKEQVLALLKSSGNNYLSGQEIADKIYVSRAAVWKAIKTLEKEGYVIDAITNRGYRIKTESQSISASSITRYLNMDIVGNMDVLYLANVDSTNEWAKRYSSDNYGRVSVMIADSQTKGKGRKGRDFYSPAGTGIYMSLLLYPESMPQQSAIYTCMMADCVCEAIKEITGIDTQIKWVNDIYYQDKKIAGILTEGITSMEDGKLQYLIIGVGINIYKPYDGFPEDINKSAGFLLDTIAKEDVRSRICAAVINRFMSCYSDPMDRSFIEGYRAKSMLIGKYVKMLTPGHDKKMSKGYALVLGVDDDCHLCIRYEDGTEDTLSCGEVSVVKY